MNHNDANRKDNTVNSALKIAMSATRAYNACGSRGVCGDASRARNILVQNHLEPPILVPLPACRFCPPRSWRRAISIGLLAIAAFQADRLQAQFTGTKPTIEWVKQFGTKSDEWSYGVSADGHGNAYVTGVTYGDLQGISAGERDVFLTKYNASGDVLWTRQYGTSSYDIGNAVSADGLGNIYVSGVTGGDLGEPLVGYGDAFISRFDDNGALRWTRQLGTTQWDTSYGMKADGLGNIYISGYTWGSLGSINAGQGDAFVSKYDDNGMLLWTRQIGTNAWEISNDVTTDKAGNVYIAGVTGYYNGSAPRGVKDALLMKYDPNGTLLWTRQFGSIGDDEITGVSADGVGQIYVAGYTNGSVGGANAGAEDVFVRKYDASGEPLWTRQFGAKGFDISARVSVDVEGNSYITGQTQGGLGERNWGSSDVFVAKFDRNGTPLWTEQFGTTSWDKGIGISVDEPGHVYISGRTQGSFGGTRILSDDVFIAKLVDIVPEPCSLLLILSGLALVLTRLRLVGCESRLSGGEKRSMRKGGERG